MLDYRLLLPPTHFHRLVARLALAAVLCAAAGCHKPAVAPGTGGGESPAPVEAAAPLPDEARRPPGTDDLTRFFRSTLPAQLGLKELKNDPPVPLPNSSPGSHAWLFNVRLRFAPNEDLVGLPPPGEARAFQSTVDELNGLVGWSRAYARSPYSRLYPAFEMQVPSPVSPQLLVIQQPKDKPLPPVYGKMAAQWQVDHWQISVVELPMPDLPGKLRSDFPAPNEIQGSPEETGFLAAAKAAIADGKAKKAIIENGYRADLAKATQPGTVYRGRVSHGADAVPAEVRFVESPLHDAEFVQMELRLPTAPGTLFNFSVRKATHVPGIELLGASGGPGDVPTTSVSKADLLVKFTSATGKVKPNDNTISNRLLILLKNSLLPADNTPVKLFEHRLEGPVAYSYDGSFILSAQ